MPCNFSCTSKFVVCECGLLRNANLIEKHLKSKLHQRKLKYFVSSTDRPYNTQLFNRYLDYQLEGVIDSDTED
jgi:hypothetical protein